MAENDYIKVILFGEEIGRLGYDAEKSVSYFQHNSAFLKSGRYSKAFPYIFKRIKPVQVFDQFNSETFKNLPPIIADSLPDRFGNIIFKKWLEQKSGTNAKLNPLEQLAYVANRGMGALEYKPIKKLPTTASVDFDEIINVLQKTLDLKKNTEAKNLSEIALFNVFKIGTSAGGVRPKILISEHEKTGKIIPGDLEYSSDFDHYLVKLCLDESGYNREKIEFVYAQLAKEAGIQMMPSKLIDDRHFATLRYDRQNGKKLHVLTVTGLTGWDFKKLENSSYENLFKLALDLKVPVKDMQQLFRRMVFNLVFANTDDHLKNHSFLYDQVNNSWSLAPAYDLTYPLNIDLNITEVSRALSVNSKRTNIGLNDVLSLAETFTIKNPERIIKEVQQSIPLWKEVAEENEIPKKVIDSIHKEFQIYF